MDVISMETLAGHIREVVERQGTALQEVERSKLFLDRQRWKDFFTDQQNKPTWMVVQGTQKITIVMSHCYWSLENWSAISHTCP